MTPAEQYATSKRKPNGVLRHGRLIVFECGIEALRTSLDLSTDDVATAVGVTRQSILNIESGRGVKLATALRLAKFFGRTVEQIWQPISDEGAAAPG